MPSQHASPESVRERARELESTLERLRARALMLDLTRGKPSSAQLDLITDLDGCLGGDYRCEDGTDSRNYGAPEGIPEARRLGGELLGVPADTVIAAGNSSLELMYLFALWAMRFGPDGRTPWESDGPVECLCPVPGYDRHFAICEELAIEMVPVPMTGRGPDMDAVEALIASHRKIRAMWCVPKYSNPTGETYDEETVRRIATLGSNAHPAFRVLWDNAYSVHDLDDHPPASANVFALARAQGNEDTIVGFASTSKISLAGGGVAFLTASDTNRNPFLGRLANMTIGPDKVNQLRHARYFRDLRGIRAHMMKHAALVRPKFELVLDRLQSSLGGKDCGTWTVPKGGYFISFYGEPGTARRIVRLCADCGVRLTEAGAAFPYGRDPEDRHIRLAPTFPPTDELETALEVFVTCAELVTLRQRLRAND